MRKLGLATLLTFAFTSSGCFLINESPTPEELEQQFDNAPPKRLIANYDPLAGILPYPSNLVFSGTEDGTINIPVGAPDDYADPQVVLNSLDGFSTMQPMTLTFNGVVDESTIRAGDTIRVFEVELYSFFLYATDVIRELDAPDPLLGKVGEYTTSIFSSVNVGPDGEAGTVDDFVYDGVMINPSQPLKPETAYVVIVTNDVRSPDGSRAKYDLIYGVSKGTQPLIDENGHTVVQYVEGATGSLGDEQAAALEPLRQINSSFETAISLATGVPTEKIIMSFGFTTQSVSTMLKAIADNLEPGDIHVGPTIDAAGVRVDTTQTLGDGSADVYVGTLDVPYYLSPNTSACHYSVDGKNGTEDCPAITDRWTGYQGNFPTKFYYIGGGYGPEQKGTETIPFFLTVPNANSGCVKPADGWPVTMFVHTMTQARWNWFAVSDIVSKKCVAGFAMDLPLHGINKHSGNAGQPGCEGATDALYAFSADAPADYVNKTCTCEAVAGEAQYSMTESEGFGIYELMPWFNDVRSTVRERTLGVDRVTNFPTEGGTTGPDGIADSSGTHFFNPAAMLTIRDAMRQAVVDLMVASKSIPTITDTWTGTELGLQIQLSTLPLIPDGCLPAGSSIPACGPLVSTGLPALQISDAAGLIFPNGSILESIVGDLTLAGASAGAVITTTEETGDPLQPELPASGALYELSKAMTVSGYVTEAYKVVCGSTDATVVANTATAIADSFSTALGASPSGAWLSDFSAPMVTGDDITAALGNATTAAEALQAASDNEAAALAAASGDITSGSWTDYGTSIVSSATSVGPLLANYIATFTDDSSDVPDFRDGVAALGDGVAALASLGGITTVGCAVGETACLGENVGNISNGTRTSLLSIYNVAAAAHAQAQAVMDLGQDGWDALSANADLQLVDVDNAAQGVAAASGVVDAALAAYEAAGDATSVELGAYLLGGCTDDVALEAQRAAAITAAGDVVGAIANATGSVAVLAAEVANTEDLADAETFVGPVATLLGAAEGALNSLTALAGSTADVTTALTAWDAGEPIFDANKVSAIGHGVGGSLAFVAASMEPAISQVALAAPSGSLAYAFEVSETVGPLLVDGLAAAAGIAPGEPLWESFFAVLQSALDQADPMNFVDHLSDEQAVLMVEIENDEFFPASDANRPMAGSSVLADKIGLSRIANSYEPGGPVRAVTRLNTDDSWGVHATFLAPYFGCVENACGVAELDLACNAANEELRQEAWSQISTFISSGGQRVDVNTVGAGTGNSLIDVVP